MPLNKTAAERKILMGRIGAAHGLAGQVRITSFTADPLAIASYSPLFTNRDGLTISITKARLSKNTVIAKLDGIDDRTSAEGLNGVELFAPRSALPRTKDKDEFLHTDLIGLAALLPDGTIFGEIIAVPNYGSTDLLEIREPDGKTTLLAFTRTIVPQIHVDRGYVTIIPPEEIAGEQER